MAVLLETSTSNNVVLSQTELEQLVLVQDERRASSRFPYMVALRIAPKLGVATARPESFQSVLGRDISSGGMSFFSTSKPYFDELEIELTSGDARYCLTAEVMGSNPMLGLEPYHLVRCKFTGHVAAR